MNNIVTVGNRTIRFFKMHPDETVWEIFIDGTFEADGEYYGLVDDDGLQEAYWAIADLMLKGRI